MDKPEEPVTDWMEVENFIHNHTRFTDQFPLVMNPTSALCKCVVHSYFIYYSQLIIPLKCSLRCSIRGTFVGFTIPVVT